ncbi:MAG: HEAT repeat domain-containing protein, partial [Propioniciclava sp.]
IVPRGREGDLAETLLAHLGRGDAEVKKSLSRALVDLALLSDGVVDLLTEARDGLSAPLAAHAEATLTLLRDPGAGFEGAYGDALRRRGLR